MTVPTYRSREDYTGNGVTTSYPYQFRIYEATDLVVTRATPDGVETPLVLNTDYTVTGVGKYAGGNVVLTSALASGYHLTIERALPVTQETDLRNQGAYFAETHEDVFDRAIMLLQRVGSYLGLGPDGALRTLLLGKTDIDGQGSFRARQNRIQDLADPVNQQDAANKRWSVQLVADSLTDGSGNAVLQLLSSSDPDKGVAKVYGATRSVATYAAVRAFTGSATRFEVGGRTNYFDGASGIFEVDPDDTSSPDNDCTILIDGSGRRVKRIFTGPVSVLWAGADRTGFADSSSAANVASAACVSAKAALYYPGGTYRQTATVYVGTNEAGALLADYIDIVGDGEDKTTINIELSAGYGFVVSNSSLRSITIAGRGKATGYNDGGVSYRIGGTVRDLNCQQFALRDFNGTAMRLSSAYNVVFNVGRVTNSAKGISFDGAGPWGLGTTTALLQSVYFGQCGTGLETVGSSKITAINVTAEYNGIGIDLGTGGSLLAWKLYREGNSTAGVKGISVNTYVDLDGTTTTSTDADSVTFNTGQRGKITFDQAVRQDLATRLGNRLGHTYFESGPQIFHVLNAYGSQAGLRDKYPLATMKPFIELTGYVKADGTIYTGDDYGLVITKVATGQYDITWNTTTFNNQGSRYPVVELTVNEANEAALAATTATMISYVNKVTTGGNFTSFGNASGIRVLIRQSVGGAAWAFADSAFNFRVMIRLGGASNEIPDFNLFGRNAS